MWKPDLIVARMRASALPEGERTTCSGFCTTTTCGALLTWAETAMSKSKIVSFIVVIILIAAPVCNADEGIQKINNTQLYYFVVGTGEPILILHGGPGLDHTYLLPQMLG